MTKMRRAAKGAISLAGLAHSFEWVTNVEDDPGPSLWIQVKVSHSSMCELPAFSGISKL